MLRFAQDLNRLSLWIYQSCQRYCMMTECHPSRYLPNNQQCNSLSKDTSIFELRLWKKWLFTLNMSSSSAFLEKLTMLQGGPGRRHTPPSRQPTPPFRPGNGLNSGNRKVTYAEDEGVDASGSEADEDARRAAVAQKNAAVAALLEPDEMTGMDDEVERVLGHRCFPSFHFQPTQAPFPNPLVSTQITMQFTMLCQCPTIKWQDDLMVNGYTAFPGGLLECNCFPGNPGPLVPVSTSDLFITPWQLS